MKKHYLFIALFFSALVIVSCKKESPEAVVVPEITSVNVNAGLGSATGTPAGRSFHLPMGVTVVGDIRGGIMGKAPIDKSYKGPFASESKSTSVTLGTGTYVNLYMALFNSTNSISNFTLPGGLIFIDSNDVYQHNPVYQKGYILQNVEVNIMPQDTVFIELKAYCLNHTLAPSSYNSVYFFGPVTANPQLNLISGIMATKQYPYGEEYNIQTIIWNVTDYGLTITAAETAYLNALP